MAESAPRAVIAGGAGLVGRHLGALIGGDGWSVDVLTRRVGRVSRGLPPGTRAVPWRARTDAQLRGILDGATAVVNLAGESLGPRPWTPGRKRALLQSRLSATNALVDAIAGLPPERRPRVLVSASGSDVYTGRDGTPADETTRPSDEFLAGLCLQWEAAALRAESLGLRVVLIRTSFVLASDAPVLRLLTLPFRLFLGGRLGSGRQWFSWIHVDDLARIYRLAIVDDALRGAVNATAPEPIQQRDLARAIGRALHRPSWLAVPALLIRAVLWGQATLVLGSRRAVPARLRAARYVFLYPELDQALADVL